MILRRFQPLPLGELWNCVCIFHWSHELKRKGEKRPQNNALILPVSIGILSIIFSAKKTFPRIPPECWPRLALACLTCSIATAAAFAKMEIIPLASSEGIGRLIVLVLSTVLGRLIFNERLNLFSCSAFVFCSIGCGLTIYGLYNNMEEMKNICTQNGK